MRCDTAALADAVWNEAAAVFAPAQLVELVALAGLYHAVSFVVNAFGVEHEEGAPQTPGLGIAGSARRQTGPGA